MKIEPRRYTSGRIAIVNLTAMIESLEHCRTKNNCNFEELLILSNLLFLRGDLLGRIADHDRGKIIATKAIAFSPNTGNAAFILAQLAERFHRFDESNAYLERAAAAGYPTHKIDMQRAAVLQATGRYSEALGVRERMAEKNPAIDTLGSLASLLAEMDEWSAAEKAYAAALDTDHGISPLPCAQLLFEWGVSAMRHGDLDQAESIFGDLDLILPSHTPGRGHRAEVALARGELDFAEVLIRPLLTTSDDPEYRATYAEILAARGDYTKARSEAESAAKEYELLLARRPEAYADHAAEFFSGIGNRPQRAIELAFANWKLRNTPRSRNLLNKAIASAKEISTTMKESAA